MANKPSASAGRIKPLVAARRRRPKEIKARIIKAAIASFAKYGFVGSRVRAIADDAGVTIQLLTHHVKSKENLWNIVMADLKQRFLELESKHPPLPAKASASDRLRVLIADSVHFTASIPELHRIMIMEAGSMSPRLVTLIESFGKQFIEEMCALIKQAQAEGTIKKKFNPARLRYAITAMTAVPFSVSAEYEYLTGKSPFSASEIERTIEQINDLVFI